MTDPIIDLGALIECYKADSHMTHTKWVEWAVLCAERALPSYEAKYPDDSRPREATNAARRWASNPTTKNRRAAHAAGAAADAAAYAAHAAADTAADAAADAAAYAAHAADAAYAAYAAYAAHAAAHAAHAAAHAAADAAYAAYAAAYAAAHAAERQWQAFRLMDVYHGNHEEIKP